MEKTKSQLVKTVTGSATNNFVDKFVKNFKIRSTEFKIKPALEVEHTSRVEYIVVSNLAKFPLIFNFEFTSLIGNVGVFEGKKELKPYEIRNILYNDGSNFPIWMKDGSNLRIWTDAYEQIASVQISGSTYYEDIDMQNTLNEIHASLKTLNQSHSDLQNRVATLNNSHEELSNHVNTNIVDYIHQKQEETYQHIDNNLIQFKEDFDIKIQKVQDDNKKTSEEINKRIDDFYNEVSEYVNSNEQYKQDYQQYFDEMIANTNSNIDIKIEDAFNSFNITSKNEALKVNKANVMHYEIDLVNKLTEEVKPQDQEIKPEENNNTDGNTE